MTTAKFLFFLFFIFLVSSLTANEPLISKKKAPLSVALPLLQSIEKYAIVIGSGPIQMYAFIDPSCPHSREFVEMVMENEKMQKSYTYHFFYYELTRFHTEKIIGTIYTEKEPLEMMKKIMIDKIEVPIVEKLSANILREIDDISKVAEELNIDKRPYLFVVKPNEGGK